MFFFELTVDFVIFSFFSLINILSLSNFTAEVDFVLQIGIDVIPVEVKKVCALAQ